MQKIFHNILLPLQLTKNSEPVIKKAVDFASKIKCNLHILCFTVPSAGLNPFFLFKKKPGSRPPTRKILNDLQDKFSRLMRNHSDLTTSISYGDPEKEISQFVFSQGIDLIYLCGADSKNRLFNFNMRRYSELAQCSVLIDSDSTCLANVEKIILPIDQSLPVYRIRIAISLAQELNASIHLISSVQKKGKDRNILFLKKAYQLLRDNTNLSLVCFTTSGMNVENAALQYAESVNAGLLVSNLNEGLQMPNFFQRIFSRFPLHRKTIPVMFVE